MWWIYGLVNVIVILLFTWIYHCEIKEDPSWFKSNMTALITTLVLAFLGGFIVTILFGGLLIYFIIDFIKFLKR